MGQGDSVPEGGHPTYPVRHEGAENQQMKVLPEQWLIWLGSYPGGCGWQRPWSKPRGQESILDGLQFHGP